jgi:hypothetical protein
MKEIETGGAYTMYKGDEKFVQHSNRKTWREDTTLKT